MCIIIFFLYSPSSPRDIFPQGLPDEYAFVTTFRFRKASRREDWYIWQIIDKYGIPQVSLRLDGENKALEYSSVGVTKDAVRASFRSGKVIDLFDRNWHKIALSVQAKTVTLYIDCKLVMTVPIKERENIDIQGKTVIGKRLYDSVPVDHLLFDLQRIVIYCDSRHADLETCCDIPSGPVRHFAFVSSDIDTPRIKQRHHKTLPLITTSMVALNVTLLVCRDDFACVVTVVTEPPPIITTPTVAEQRGTEKTLNCSHCPFGEKGDIGLPGPAGPMGPKVLRSYQPWDQKLPWTTRSPSERVKLAIPGQLALQGQKERKGNLSQRPKVTEAVESQWRTRRECVVAKQIADLTVCTALCKIGDLTDITAGLQSCRRPGSTPCRTRMQPRGHFGSGDCREKMLGT
ncbi:unnamed protein product, partial [Ranitomeya imitator]